MRRFATSSTAALFAFWISPSLLTADTDPSLTTDTPAASESPDPVTSLLVKFGQPTNGLSGRELARTLLLEEGAQSRISAMVEALSNSDFQVREEAAADLIGVPFPVEDALWSARKVADPGLAIMLDRILETRQGLRAMERTGYLFKVIAESGLEGLAVPVARTAAMVDFAGDLEVARAGVAAVLATVIQSDAAALRSVIDAEPEKQHPAVFAGLTALAVRANENLPAANGSLQRLGIAYALASLGDGRAIAVLAGLLKDESAAVRSEAMRLLEDTTGNRDQFVGAHDPVPARLQKVEWWLKLGAEAGGAPEIKAVSPGGGWRGITIAGTGGKGGNRLVEFGMAGSEEGVFKSGIGGINGTPLAVLRAANGRTAILTSSGANTTALHLFSQDGRWSWPGEGLPGTGGFAILEGGNFLICDPVKPALNEYDWLGNKVGERPLPGVANGLQNLPGGRFLVSLPAEKAIVEVAPDGSEVWRLDNLEEIKFARRLANGNHLVAYADGLTEFNASGESVWKVEASRAENWGEILCAARRPGGNTYIGTDQGIKELTRGLRVVKQVGAGRINTMESY